MGDLFPVFGGDRGGSEYPFALLSGWLPFKIITMPLQYISGQPPKGSHTIYTRIPCFPIATNKERVKKNFFFKLYSLCNASSKTSLGTGLCEPELAAW